MSTMEAELTELKKAREKVDADIAKANATINETQSKLSEANSLRACLLTKIAAAEKTAGELATAKATAKAQREKVTSDLKQAQAAFDELQKHLNAELPAERRAAIAAAVAKIDGAIDDARTDVATEQKKTLDSEAAANEAKKKVSAAEADYKQAGEELRQWPNRVEATRTQITKLVTDAKSAIDAGRIHESYLRSLELKEAIAMLPLISSPESEDKVTKAFTEKAKAADTAANDAARATDGLNKQKATQAAAEAELKRREQKRAADLKDAMAAMPLASAEAPAPAQASSATPTAR